MPNREQEKLPDLLESLRKQGDGLSGPGEAYFEAIAAKAIAQAKAPAVKRSLRTRWLAVAASVIGLLFATWWIVQPAEGTDPSIAEKDITLSSDELLAEINVEDIDAYVSDQIDEFTLELYEEAPIKE